MNIMLTVVMVAGFARTYFFAGLFRARLPGLLIHVHGAVFTCWFVLLLVQSALAASGRVDLHRRLGIAGIVVAGLMIPLGFMATAEFIRRLAPSFPRIRINAIMPVAELIAFAVLAAAAFLARKKPDHHKRLILLATIALIPAATGRIEFLPLFHFHGPSVLRLVWAYTYIFLLPLVAYDVWSRRRLHPATAYGGAFLIGSHQIALFLCTTPLWVGFAHWLESWSL